MLSIKHQTLQIFVVYVILVSESSS